MKTQITKGFIIFSSVALAVLVFFYLSKNSIPREAQPAGGAKWGPSPSFEKFKTDQEFKDYLEKAQTDTNLLKSSGVRTDTAEISAPAMIGGAPAPDRYSQTNVQVKGIDEPDIVKTDGREIYYSTPQFDKIMAEPNLQFAPSERTKILPIPPDPGGTLAIKAYPLENLKKDGKIDKTGELLLNNDILIILGSNEITGYNVKNPSSPTKDWQINLKDNIQIISTRLYKNKLYLIAKKYMRQDRPCPIEVFSTSIKCTDVYHPAVEIQADSVYTAVRANSQNGEIEKVISFIGSSESSAVYMSENSLYSTYYYMGDTIAFFTNFLSENKDLIPSSILDKIKKLNSYDISQNSKLTEFTTILDKYQNSLDDDERLKFENNLNNKMASYQKTHQRDLGRTGIVKIDLDSLEISAHANVPGRPLNQFSLDEYENNLRIAVTIGEGWWGLGFGQSSDSANDVYVLDSNLKITGSVTDLGLTEKIYSARFIEDKGYLVTFRQTDPFYVLDLSNPKNPKLAGQLKIPGFSSYLHPINKDTILGVGMEGQKVKLSLFDVSNPQNPTETDKYNLDDYWTEVSNNYHAFMQDKLHKIFFLPGSKGGYVFSYKNSKLDLVKTLADSQIKRALYINDFLYIISDGSITVFNEKSWEKVNQLTFD